MPEISQRAELMPASPIRKLVPLAEAARARGTKIYHLNIGQPDIATPAAYFDAVKSFSQPVLAYAPSDGVPEMIDGGFAMAAAHSDSPTFRLKEHPDRRSAHYVQLSTEKYGGMILSTWLDRPLSVAGRLAVKNGNGIEGRLVNIDRDLCVIPNVAIHMNREMNKGVEYNPQVDLLPLLADVSFDEYDAHTTYDAQTASENAEEQPEAVEKPTLVALAAESAGGDAETILG